MPRAHHVTHGRTAERLDKIRKLITALQDRQLMREDIADLLQMSPSGTRKYIADLRDAGVMEIARYVDGTATFLGYPEYRLTPDADRVRDYLASMPASARKEKVPDLAQAQRDAGRHFHILADDTHYAIRVNSGIPAHEPVHAAFWRMASSEARV